VLATIVETDLTIQQIARSLSSEWHRPVTVSAVKHTLERVMTKMQIEPRTRASLVKHVLAAASGQQG
jgi:hypothetical protein